MAADTRTVCRDVLDMSHIEIDEMLAENVLEMRESSVEPQHRIFRDRCQGGHHHRPFVAL